jgi:trehalose 6-phosphate synthase/phosphatase
MGAYSSIHQFGTEVRGVHRDSGRGPGTTGASRMLVIVSNRLPVSLAEEEGRLEFAQSPGGLASGLRTYLDSPRSAVGAGYAWVGWPGRTVAPDRQTEVMRRCREDFSARPVFLSAEDTEGFYEGFCNQTLWPLFHYFPALVSFEQGPWATYERINGVFCDAVLEEAEPGDVVWIHDYHFLLLPAMLRAARPGLKIGFFLHIPFPSYELFRLLPDRWRRALLEGILGADLVGFHTHDYAQHFLKSVRRILGHDHEMGRVMLPDRLSRADTFPMGIEFDAFSARGAEPEVIGRRDELRRTIGGGKAILSIDRLDYSKGIANRLLAYRAFLEASPEWRGRVVLLMVVVPSRTGVEDYQRMKSRVDELVGEVNGSFGSLSWTPVLYQYKSFPQEELVPMYGASDVMLVTPLRDGMNLVAKEYVAARADGRGVLILSEMTGAASELGEAMIVNPNDIPEMARALATALEMSEEDQASRMTALRDRLRRYDVVRWAGDFLEALDEDRSRLDRRMLSTATRERIVREFRSADRRLLLLDYDGTLVPLEPTPEKAAPGPGLLALLGRLAGLGDVAIVSGRPRATLDAWLGRLDVALVAEHGAWVRERGGNWAATGALFDDWKPGVRDLMERYVDRLPGARVEEKEFALAWHYRLGEPDLAALRAQELSDHLIDLTETSELRVIQGHKVVEVRPAGTSKGTACQVFLSRGYGFVLGVGDDATDEDLFRVLPPSAYSIRVGLTQSYARFNVADQAEAFGLIESLATTPPESTP